MNRSASPLNRSMNSSKRYVSPNERQNTEQAVKPNFQDQSEISSVLGDNNVSKMSNMTQFSNHLYVPCPTHPEFFITNICQDANCIEPLCAECINIHLENHSKKGSVPKFENIQRVRKNNVQKIEDLAKQLQLSLQETKKYFLETPIQIYNKTLEELRQIQEQITNVIDDYFETLYKELKEQHTKQQQYVDQLTGIDTEIQKQLKTLINLQDDLHNDNYVRAIIQICDQKSQIFKQTQISQLENLMLDFQQKQLKVVFESNSMDLFQTYVKKICYFNKASIPQVKQQSIQIPAATTIKKQEINKFTSSLLSSDLPPIINPVNLISDTLTNDEAKCNINIKNHFEDGQSQIIVRLEEGGYTAYIYNIETKEYKIQTLNSAIKIPQFHRLYTTQQGKHLLIGGVDRDKSRFKAIPQVYEFNHQTLQLMLFSEMILSRSMTTACQVDNYLYVVGGSSTNDENTSIAKAERMDLTTRKWYSIEDPYYKVCGCALVAINDNTIIKIGGKSDIFTPCNSIEQYDIKKNIWTKIEFKFQSNGYLRLPFNSCAVQITYDQILILGGSIHDVKSDETQILNIKSKTVQKSIQLPNSIEFNTQTAIVQSNIIYILTENDQPLLYGNQNGFKYQ